MFDDDARFAKTVVMDRDDFGQGVYRYFKAPIPAAVDGLRRRVYPHVARIANEWQGLLNEAERFPEEWEDFPPALPGGRPDDPDADPAQVRSGRLQRPAPRSARIGLLPDPDGGGPHPMPKDSRRANRRISAAASSILRCARRQEAEATGDPCRPGRRTALLHPGPLGPSRRCTASSQSNMG